MGAWLVMMVYVSGTPLGITKTLLGVGTYFYYILGYYRFCCKSYAGVKEDRSPPIRR